MPPPGSVATVADAGPALSPGRARGRIPTAVMVVVYLAALGAFVGIVAVRGGPSVGDAYGVTKPATALADGDLHAAAHDSVLPQPPGYALLTSPLVLAFRPLIGSPNWCDARVAPVTRFFLPWCAPAQLATHHWYRSQAVLGLLAWIVLALGVHPAPAGGRSRRGGRRGGARDRAGGDPGRQRRHRRDVSSPGPRVCRSQQRGSWPKHCDDDGSRPACLFGVAFLCKQFALLPLVAVLVAVPGWRERVRVAVPALVAVGAGVIPFAAADPSATWNALSAVQSGGVVKLSTGTVLGMTNLPESTKLVIARDGPVVLALVMALWARWRVGDHLLSPVPLIGLTTACLAGRLVTEVWFASYYLLAVSAGLLVLDLARRRLPVASFLWIAGTGALVEQNGGLPTTDLGRLSGIRGIGWRR